MSEPRLDIELLGLPVKQHRGGLVLVAAIAGILGLIPFAALAWWMGSRDLDEMYNGTMNSSGRNLTNLGRFLGMAVTTLFIAASLGSLIFGWLL